MSYTSSVHLQDNPLEARKLFAKYLKNAGLITAAMLSLSFTSRATTFTASGVGNFNQESVWKPAYPGNVIDEEDTIIIASNVSLNVDVIVKGFAMVKTKGSLTGEKNLVVLEKGAFVNQGTIIVSSITNRGLLLNKHIMETSKDLINTGKLTNDESMVVGNILDNTGTLTGNGGNTIANKKLVNSKTGEITGNIDVCSSNFMNVDGAKLDSANISFCGHRIFNSVFLTANLKKESVVLNLLNSQNKRFKEYTIEKSIDGITYQTVAVVKGSELQDLTAPFKYTDNQLAASNSLYYRIKLTDNDGSVKTIPAVEVGNIQATGMSASIKK